MGDSRKYYRFNGDMLKGAWTPAMLAYLLAGKVERRQMEWVLADVRPTDEHADYFRLQMRNGQRFVVHVMKETADVLRKLQRRGAVV